LAKAVDGWELLLWEAREDAVSRFRNHWKLSA